jgi:glycerol transport system ATP-binding protein
MDCAIPLGRRYRRLASGAKVEIGVRPEFARSGAAGGPGLPVACAGSRMSAASASSAPPRRRDIAVVPEGREIDAQARMDASIPKAVNVYADGWLVEGEDPHGWRDEQDRQSKAWFIVLPVVVLVAFSRSCR